MRKAILAGTAALGIALMGAPADAVIITDATPQSGAMIDVSDPAPYPLTGPDWDFGTDAFLISGITKITIGLQIYDGDTGEGDFDFGDLTLALDGIDTGLLLNGFGDGLTVAAFVHILSPATAGAILTALQADGKLTGTIFDADGGDQILHFPADFGTSLTLEGPAAEPVPEPGTLMLLGGGLASLALKRRRRN